LGRDKVAEKLVSGGRSRKKLEVKVREAENWTY
jgi:hypothetical protein